VKSYIKNLIWNYAPWIAIVLFCVGLFIALIANGIVFPLVLLCFAIGFTLFRYWADIKKFDFWALDEWVHAKMDSIGIREWHTPYHGAEHFCDPAVVRERNEAAAKMNSIMMELIKANDQNIRSPGGANHLSASDSERARPFSGGSGLRQLDYEAVQARRDRTNLVLAQELTRRLVAGNLIAKGLPTQSDTTHSERIIPTSRWRVMKLDISKAEASGRGLHYIGIVIGKKPTT